jgi:hypothetical protein
MDLYRPTGLCELQLVLARDLAGWPPRLPEQPIFYPVLNRGYAEQIARDWNATSEGQVGYATWFEVDDGFLARFPRQVVGGRQHEELWVPAEELEALNRHLRGPIRVVSAFFGSAFRGLVPETGRLRGKDARAQLAALLEEGPGALAATVAEHRDAIFLHLPLWRLEAPASIAAIEEAWRAAFPHLPLPGVP